MQEENILYKIWRVLYPPAMYLFISFIVQFPILLFLSIRNIASSEMVSASELENSLTQDLYQYAVLMTIIAALITLPILFVLYRGDKKKAMIAGTYREVISVSPLLYLLIIILSVFACIGFNNLVSLIPVQNVETYEEIEEALYGGNIIIQIIGISFIVPVLEELLFRGIVYNRLKRYMNKNMAVILSAVIFGVYHMNLLQGVYAFALGLLLVFVYEKYKNLIAPILFHMAANGFSLIMTHTTILNPIYDKTVYFVISTIVELSIVAVMVIIIRDKIHVVEKSNRNEEFYV